MKAEAFPFEGKQDQDVITVVMKSGESFTGSYMTQAGMHFVGTKVDKGTPERTILMSQGMSM